MRLSGVMSRRPSGRRPLVVTLAALLLAPAVLTSTPGLPAAGSTRSSAPPATDDVVLPRGHARIVERIAEQVRTRVVVGLRTTFVPEGDLGDASADAQRARIARIADGLEAELTGSDARSVTRLTTLASVVVEVGPTGLERLLRSPRVASVEPEVEFELALAESIPLIGADAMHVAGATGDGVAVAVLDTGVDTSHPAFAGRIVAEACFSSDAGTNRTLCPGGAPVEIGSGAGVHCALVTASCFHGTHVAGIVAGAVAPVTGVAPAADLIPIQVFHAYDCSVGLCVRASLSDLVAALDHVATLVDSLASTTRVVAVNMSLGGGLFTSACDASYPVMADAIANLASKGVAVITSSGNSGAVDAIGMPACLSGAIAVGSSTDADTVSNFSNGHPTLVDLLAPGSNITSASPGGGTRTASGTSGAAPHVAGAWALLAGQRPSATNAELLADLRTESVSVTDTRPGAGFTTPRLSLTAFVPETPPSDPDLVPDETAPPVPQSGLLRVTTSPAVASSISVGGVHRADWGLDWVSLETGDHEVCFGDVPGFVTPPCQTVTLAPDVTTVVEGTFEPLGLLKVDVAPGGLPATIHVDGAWRDEYGLFAYAEAGTYRVCWGDVFGHAAPPCVDATVAAGATTTVVGTYEIAPTPVLGPAPAPDGHGFLRVVTSPAVSSRISVDGSFRGDWGLNWVKVPAGMHEVCFTGLPGFAKPECRTVEVFPDITTETIGVFRAHGLLRVDVEPSVAVDVLVDGASRNQFGLYTFIAPGSYRVCGTATADGRTAACQQAVVVGGQEARVVLDYGG